MPLIIKIVLLRLENALLNVFHRKDEYDAYIFYLFITISLLSGMAFIVLGVSSRNLFFVALGAFCLNASVYFGKCEKFIQDRMFNEESLIIGYESGRDEAGQLAELVDAYECAYHKIYELSECLKLKCDCAGDVCLEAVQLSTGIINRYAGLQGIMCAAKKTDIYLEDIVKVSRTLTMTVTKIKCIDCLNAIEQLLKGLQDLSVSILEIKNFMVTRN